jgi:hypothetical protein
MRKKVIIALITILLANLNLMADEWEKEYKKRYTSQNGIFKLIIVPTYVPKNYDKEIRKRNKKPEKYLNIPMKDTIIPCHAKLLKKTSNFGILPVLIWEKELTNPTAPYEAIITNDGKYVITFDDWYKLGHGENVMVVYNENGELIKKHRLFEITKSPISQLKNTVTSIWWYFGHETYSENPNKIKILIIDNKSEIEERIYDLDKLEFEESK